MKLTDEQLRAEIEQGLTAAQIAAKHNVSRQAISQRVKKLVLTTTCVAVAAPAESRRFVNRQIDAMERICRYLEHIELQIDAVDARLRDADDPTKYDVGPFANEIEVQYFVRVHAGDGLMRTVKKKAPLSKLLTLLDKIENDTVFSEVEGAESKFADPRELLLKTVQEGRQLIATGVDLLKLLADARAMQALREAILNEIGKVDPHVAQRIAERVQSVVILYAAAGGPETLPADAGR